MRQMLRWVLAGAVPLAITTVRAQTPPAQSAPTIPVYRLRVLGVFDDATGEPVEGADVIDVTSGTKATTTKTGTVSLFFLPDGGSLVRIRKLGYEVQTIPVAIAPTEKTPVTVLLKAAVTLPTVEVKDTSRSIPSRLRDFEERRKGGFGQFITDTVFRKNDNMTLGAVLLGHFAGLQLVTLPVTYQTVMVSARTPCQGLAFAKCTVPNCFVTIYIDNVQIFNASMPTSAELDVGRLTPMDYAAAEFYPGGSILPAGISPTNSQCGTLLLYTRDR